MLGSQASGTQVESFGLAVYIKRGRVNIGDPAAVGMPFGVANIMTKLWGFPTQIALQCDFSFDY